jgi:cation:H+ antiporter
MLYPLSVQRSVVRQEIPVLLIASLAVVWFLDDGIIDVWNGCLLLGGLLVYIFISFLYSRKDPNPESSEIEEYTTTQHTVGAVTS